MDSQGAIKSIRCANTKSHCVRLCKEAINRLAGENSVKLIWVLSHIGIEENENADELAGSGAAEIAASYHKTTMG